MCLGSIAVLEQPGRTGRAHGQARQRRGRLRSRSSPRRGTATTCSSTLAFRSRCSIPTAATEALALRAEGGIRMSSTRADRHRAGIRHRRDQRRRRLRQRARGASTSATRPSTRRRRTPSRVRSSSRSRCRSLPPSRGTRLPRSRPKLLGLHRRRRRRRQRPVRPLLRGARARGATQAAFIHKTLVVWVALLAVPLLHERLGPGHVGAIALLLAGQCGSPVTPARSSSGPAS